MFFYRPLTSPSYFVKQAQCKTQPMKGTCSDILQMGGGFRHPPTPPLFRSASTMQIKNVNGCKKRVCSDFRQCSVNGVWGLQAPQTQNPSHFVRQARCKTKPIKGCNNRHVLIFVHALEIWGGGGVRPANPSRVCNAMALLSKSGCARNFVLPYLSNSRHLIIFVQQNNIC